MRTVAKEDIKPGAGEKKEPWSLQKKIVVTVIGIAIIVLAAVLVAKLVFVLVCTLVPLIPSKLYDIIRPYRSNRIEKNWECLHFS